MMVRREMYGAKRRRRILDLLANHLNASPTVDSVRRGTLGFRAGRAIGIQTFIAVLLALTVAVAFATSSVTISRELHHDCAGDGCAVCAEMATGLHLSRGGFSLPGAPVVPTAALLLFMFLALGIVSYRIQLTTLVALKVQLND